MGVCPVYVATYERGLSMDHTYCTGATTASRRRFPGDPILRSLVIGLALGAKGGGGNERDHTKARACLKDRKPCLYQEARRRLAALPGGSHDCPVTLP